MVGTWSFVWSFALVFATTTNAWAQGKATADTLFDEGKALLGAGNWPAACAKFQASFDADPAVSTSIKLARCREHEGKLIAAVAEYRRASELNRSLPQVPERKRDFEALIRDDLAALGPRVPKLRFEITPRTNGLEVWVNGARVPDAGLAAPYDVDPGEAEVVVRAPGHRQERLKPSVPEGVTHDLVIRLVPVAPLAPAAPVANAAPMVHKAPAPASTPTDSPSGVPRSSQGSGQRTFGLIVGGAGVVTLGVAAYFGLQTIVLVNQATPRCPDDVCDDDGYRMMHDAADAQTVGLVLGGVGAALIGTGTLIYITSPNDDSRPGQATLAARIGPSSVSLEGAF